MFFINRLSQAAQKQELINNNLNMLDTLRKNLRSQIVIGIVQVCGTLKRVMWYFEEGGVVV